jgi:hypothetical protein
MVFRSLASAPCHAALALSAWESLAKHRGPVAPQTLYSPDLPPPPRLKCALKGKRLQDAAEMGWTLHDGFRPFRNRHWRAQYRRDSCTRCDVAALYFPCTKFCPGYFGPALVYSVLQKASLNKPHTHKFKRCSSWSRPDGVSKHSTLTSVFARLVRPSVCASCYDSIVWTLTCGASVSQTDCLAFETSADTFRRLAYLFCTTLYQTPASWDTYEYLRMVNMGLRKEVVPAYFNVVSDICLQRRGN